MNFDDVNKYVVIFGVGCVVFGMIIGALLFG